MATWAREATFPVTKVAAYAAMRGEIDPSPTLTALGVRRVAYPRMAGNALEFRCPANATAMKKHRLGMTEPLPTDPPFELAEADVIFVPLALFDRRIGSSLNLATRKGSSPVEQGRSLGSGRRRGPEPWCLRQFSCWIWPIFDWFNVARRIRVESVQHHGERARVTRGRSRPDVLGRFRVGSLTA